MSTERCEQCGKDAVWNYSPGIGRRCDECVPRTCAFCNSDDEGVPHPKPWKPCVEWMKIQPAPTDGEGR